MGSPLTIPLDSLIDVRLDAGTHYGVSDGQFQLERYALLGRLLQLDDEKIVMGDMRLSDLPAAYRMAEPRPAMVLAVVPRLGDGNDELHCGLTFRSADGLSESPVYRIHDECMSAAVWEELIDFAVKGARLSHVTAGLRLPRRPSLRARMTPPPSQWQTTLSRLA